MIVRLRLMPWQIEILQDPHPIKVVIAGRQVGKSHMLQAQIAKCCGERPGNSAIVMPVQPQATAFFKLTKDSPGFRHLLLPDEQGFKLWPHPILNFRSGHSCEWRSFENPIRLRGGKWTGFAGCDEANDLNGDDVARVILPKISTTTAPVFITSTITHVNWLWEWYLRGQADDPVIKSWLIPTMEEDGTSRGFAFQGEQGLARLGQLKSVTPQWIWDSEYLCIPATDNSTAFPGIEKCLVDTKPPDGPEHGKTYVIGLDLARVKDQEVAIVLELDGRQINVVDYLEFPSGSKALSHTQMAQRVLSLSNQWNEAPVIIDATGKGARGNAGDSYVEIYEQIIEDRVEKFFWSPNKNNQTKYDLISYVALLTDQGALRIPKKFRELIVQMQSYRILKAAGSASTFGPARNAKVNDDAVSALAQACWALKREIEPLSPEDSEYPDRDRGYGNVGSIMG